MHRLPVLLLVFAGGCGGDGSFAGGTSGPAPAETAANGGSAFALALTACQNLGIHVTSTREGSLISGELPESSPYGTARVNIMVSGSRVTDIRFYNAPDDSIWVNRWRSRILEAIKAAASR